MTLRDMLKHMFHSPGWNVAVCSRPPIAGLLSGFACDDQLFNLGYCTLIFLLELSLQQTGIEHWASEPGRYWKSTWISVN